MKAGEIKKLENIYRRKVPAHEFVTAELGRYMTLISRDIGRQVAVLIDRGGGIPFVIVGDKQEITIPDLADYSLGPKKLRGLRLVHTHLREEPLTNDDLTDLALLRLDAMCALGVQPDGFPGRVYVAHLLPPNPEEKTWALIPPFPFHQLDIDPVSFTEALEDEMLRVQAESFDVKDTREKAILISVMPKRNKAVLAEQKEAMEELVELARSADVLVLETVLQRPDKLSPKYLMGSGRLKDVIITALQKGATMLIFDQELTPSQINNITEMTEMKVIDRSQLILDIFSRRAHSKDGKVQVELAQLKYMLPRLMGKGTAMSRLMGGIGGRGPGETKLESDRRRVRDRISQLERALGALSAARKQRKTRRADAGLPIVSIVGYTNAGKSTLLNKLTQSDTIVEDKLFATLDTASRRLRFPRDHDVIITDTVGFIRDLPAPLFAAFHATLEELADADLLMHVVDISSPRFEEQMASVESILQQLGLDDKERIIVFNKADLVDPDIAFSIARRYEGIALSALDRKTFPPLMQELEERLWEREED
ncbi:MAG: GTPase HflX [Nitrospirae bacterium]|nr:GTPase HflX [Nitrospirota bacterium]